MFVECAIRISTSISTKPLLFKQWVMMPSIPRYLVPGVPELLILILVTFFLRIFAECILAHSSNALDYGWHALCIIYFYHSPVHRDHFNDLRERPLLLHSFYVVLPRSYLMAVGGWPVRDWISIIAKSTRFIEYHTDISNMSLFLALCFVLLLISISARSRNLFTVKKKNDM